MLRGLNWYLFTGVSGRHTNPIFKGPAVWTAGPLKIGWVCRPETSVTTNPCWLTTWETKELTTDITLCIQTTWLSEYEIGVNAD
jgi:hypothetical protein